MNTDAAWYAGASLGQSSYPDWGPIFDDGSLAGNSSDDSDTAWRAFAGVDFGRHFALELGYADFGEASNRAQSDGSGSLWAAGPVGASTRLEGFDLQMVGKLPLSENLSVFGKAGALQWASTLKSYGTTQCCGPATLDLTDDGLDLIFSAGLQYDGFRPLRVLAAYADTSYGVHNVIGQADIKSLTLSVAYLFGTGQASGSR